MQAGRSPMALVGYARVIPTRLNTDTCPVPGADGADALWVTNEEVPRADTGIDDGLVGVPNQGGQFIAAQEFPDVLHWVELGTISGQIEQGDVCRNAQA